MLCSFEKYECYDNERLQWLGSHPRNEEGRSQPKPPDLNIKQWTEGGVSVSLQDEVISELNFGLSSRIIKGK